MLGSEKISALLTLAERDADVSVSDLYQEFGITLRHTEGTEWCRNFSRLVFRVRARVPFWMSEYKLSRDGLDRSAFTTEFAAALVEPRRCLGHYMGRKRSPEIEEKLTHLGIATCINETVHLRLAGVSVDRFLALAQEVDSPDLVIAPAFHFNGGSTLARAAWSDDAGVMVIRVLDWGLQPAPVEWHPSCPCKLLVFHAFKDRLQLTEYETNPARFYTCLENECHYLATYTLLSSPRRVRTELSFFKSGKLLREERLEGTNSLPLVFGVTRSQSGAWLCAVNIQMEPVVYNMATGLPGTLETLLGGGHGR